MCFFYDVHTESKYLTVTIMDILNDRIKLKHVASASYKHLLGFDKIVIKENFKTGDKLRLHIWWPNAPQGDENIHHHRWSFNSTILIGELENQKYEENEKGNLFHSYIYTPPYREEKYNLTSCGTKKIILTEKSIFKAGDSYEQHYSVRHRSKRKSPFVVTLFSQGPPMVDFTETLTEEPIYAVSQEVNAIRMSENQIKETLLFLYNELDSNKLAANQS